MLVTYGMKKKIIPEIYQEVVYKTLLKWTLWGGEVGGCRDHLRVTQVWLKELPGLWNQTGSHKSYLP